MGGVSGEVRSVGDYDRRVKVIGEIGENGVKGKWGMMVGLGERREEVEERMDEVVEKGWEIVRIGE